MLLSAGIPIYPIPGFADPFSSLSHLLGAGVFAVLSVFLLLKGRRHRGRRVWLGTFAAASVLLLAMSGIYHLLGHELAGRAVMQRLDHAAIFVLIAASFSAPHGI